MLAVASEGGGGQNGVAWGGGLRKPEARALFGGMKLRPLWAGEIASFHLPKISADETRRDKTLSTTNSSLQSLLHGRTKMAEESPVNHDDQLVHSDDPEHPANLICVLCAKFYTLGWVQILSPFGQ